MQTIAVVGFNDFAEEYLAARLGDSAAVRFVPALTREEIIITEKGFPFEERLEMAASRIEAEKPDGIITYWDFPSSLLTPLLAERYGFTYASLDSTLKCGHKYWFRLEQAQVLDTPAFDAFDPFADDPRAHIDLDYPFWIKPVVGHSSMLGFEITDRQAFDAALTEIRRDIEALTAPFSYPLSQGNLPRKLRDAGATMCLAEELISAGDQYTIEGYVHAGEVRVYGVVESVREPNGHTFNRYQYPARLGRDTQARMEDVAERLMRQIGYDDCPFNMEFFHEPESGTLHVLEVNARLSQSHAHLFDKVDGQPHVRIAVDLALGRSPHWESGKGPDAVAAKHFLRRTEDGRVRRVPDTAQLEQVDNEVPGVIVELKVAEGERLSEVPEQEEYSYELADLFIGGSDEDELLRKYERTKELVSFDID